MIELLDKSDSEIREIAEAIWIDIKKVANERNWSLFSKYTPKEMATEESKKNVERQWETNKVLTTLTEKHGQWGRKVTYQYNAYGDISFGAVQNKADVIGELKKLRQELSRAIEQKAVEGDAAIDAEYEVKKALAQVEKPQADKTTLREHLTRAKDLVSGVSGLAGAFALAVEKVQAIF